jgi:hypothetical protein
MMHGFKNTIVTLCKTFIFVCLAFTTESTAKNHDLSQTQLDAFLGIITNFILDDGERVLTITSLSTVLLEENKPFSFAIHSVYAEGNVSYEMYGTDSAYFTLNSNTGQVSIKSLPDYETKNRYIITVKVTDS